MASTYFTLPSFARAKRNQEELRKSNPQVPVLKPDDEKFLEQQIDAGTNTSQDKLIFDNKGEQTKTEITDDGTEKEVPVKDDSQMDGVPTDQVVVPEVKPAEAQTAPTVEKQDKEKKPAQKSKGLDLPSQEEAEAATHGWDAQFASQSKDGADKKRTWMSYIPGVGTGTAKKDEEKTDDATGGEKSESAKEDEKDKQMTRSWTEYASSYVPSQLPSLPQMPTWNFRSKDKDAQVKTIYKEDGTVDEAATANQQENEIAVLLDNLNMSTMNNRVFALSTETQKVYDRFAQILKDTINGVPTAYDDMEKFMREAGPTLEKNFKAMPPFVQTLVKSLPAKLGATLAPELLAAASEKPGADLKASMAANEGASSSKKASSSSAKNKSKRRIPALKNILAKEGAVATILRNVVTFLRTRFPFLASTTNVVMSLAVFILMFVFYYCYKRGKEVRLEKEKRDAEASLEVEGEEEDDEVASSETDDEEGEDENEAFQRQWEEKLTRPEPAQVPLPPEETDKEAV